MHQKKFFIVSLNTILSLLIFALWPIHINEKEHTQEDGKCPICISITSPQLNSDCGSELILKTREFIGFQEPFVKGLPAKDFYAFSLPRSPPFYS